MFHNSDLCSDITSLEIFEMSIKIIPLIKLFLWHFLVVLFHVTNKNTISFLILITKIKLCESQNILSSSCRINAQINMEHMTGHQEICNKCIWLNWLVFNLLILTQKVIEWKLKNKEIFMPLYLSCFFLTLY